MLNAVDSHAPDRGNALTTPADRTPGSARDFVAHLVVEPAPVGPEPGEVGEIIGEQRVDELRGQDAPRVEAGVDASQVHEGAAQRAGAREQHDRERHFDHHEPVSNPA